MRTTTRRARELPRGRLGSAGATAEQHRRPEPDLRRLLQRHGRAARRASARRRAARPTTRSAVRTARRSSIPRRSVRRSRRTWPLVGGMPRPLRSATAGSWPSPGSTSPAARRGKWRSTTSTTRGPAGAPPRTFPRHRRFTRERHFCQAATSSTRDTGAARRTRLATSSILRTGPGPLRPRRRGTGPTAPSSCCRCCHRATGRG
jgi:hypothetical protein